MKPIEAIKTDVFDGRVLNYRRNTVVAAIILIFVTSYEGVDLEGVRPLGIPLNDETGLIVPSILLLGVIYNAFFFLYYGFRDRNRWIDNFLTASKTEMSNAGTSDRGFSEYGMFYKKPPSKPENCRFSMTSERSPPKAIFAKDWEFTEQNAYIHCDAILPDNIPNGVRLQAIKFKVAKQVYHEFRYADRFNIWVELGFPLAMAGLACLIFIAWYFGVHILANSTLSPDTAQQC